MRRLRPWGSSPVGVIARGGTVGAFWSIFHDFSFFFIFLIFLIFLIFKKKIWILKTNMWKYEKNNPKHVWMIPETCPDGPRNMPRWCPKHVWMMPEWCPKHVQIMPKTCLNDAQNMSKWYPKHVWMMPKTCMNNAQYIICFWKSNLFFETICFFKSNCFLKKHFLKKQFI